MPRPGRSLLACGTSALARLVVAARAYSRSQALNFLVFSPSNSQPTRRRMLWSDD